MEIIVPHELRDILARLEMMSHGTITNYHSQGGGVADSKPPTGENDPPHEIFRRRYEACVSPLSKERVIEEAAAALQAWTAAGRRPQSVEESTVDRDARMILEGEGWAPRDVALKFSCTPKYVERVRRNAGVPTDTGKRPVLRKAVDDEVRELLARGLSERQIRMFTGCGGSKIAKLKGAS